MTRRQLTETERELTIKLIHRVQSLPEDRAMFWLAAYAGFLEEGLSPEDSEKETNKVVDELDNNQLKVTL